MVMVLLIIVIIVWINWVQREVSGKFYDIIF